jgi:single-strand DNA-binding protein
VTNDNLSLTGLVATPPRLIATRDGVRIATFRLASNQRRFDRLTNKWVDGETNWYSVTAFRQLADNVMTSLTKGDRVVVTGRLRLRNWQNGDRSGTNAEVEADSVGHDLTFGSSRLTRILVARPPESAPPADGAAAEALADVLADVQPGLGEAEQNSIRGAVEADGLSHEDESDAQAEAERFPGALVPDDAQSVPF